MKVKSSIKEQKFNDMLIRIGEKNLKTLLIVLIKFIKKNKEVILINSIVIAFNNHSVRLGILMNTTLEDKFTYTTNYDK